MESENPKSVALIVAHPDDEILWAGGTMLSHPTYDRNEMFNKPGDYHNGGIWPFICGFYVAALVAAKRYV